MEGCILTVEGAKPTNTKADQLAALLDARTGAERFALIPTTRIFDFARRNNLNIAHCTVEKARREDLFRRGYTYMLRGWFQGEKPGTWMFGHPEAIAIAKKEDI